jgi:hypothetical protein
MDGDDGRHGDLLSGRVMSVHDSYMNSDNHIGIVIQIKGPERKKCPEGKAKPRPAGRGFAGIQMTTGDSADGFRFS